MIQKSKFLCVVAIFSQMFPYRGIAGGKLACNMLSLSDLEKVRGAGKQLKVTFTE